MRNAPMMARMLVALVLAASGAGAQEPGAPAEYARLVGDWRLDPGGPPVAPERRVISMSPEWLKVEIHRPEDDRPPVLIYRFDGKEAVNPFGSGKAISRLLREGAAIMTETIYEVRNSPITVRETLTVDPAGGELTVDTVLRVEHGYEGALAAGEKRSPNVSNSTAVFRKTR